jgi:hypothetical protein
MMRVRLVDGLGVVAGAAPGCAAMITLLSHDGTCCIGMNTDTLAITDPGRARRRPAPGLDEVVALRG